MNILEFSFWNGFQITRLNTTTKYGPDWLTKGYNARPVPRIPSLVARLWPINERKSEIIKSSKTINENGFEWIRKSRNNSKVSVSDPRTNHTPLTKMGELFDTDL